MPNASGAPVNVGINPTTKPYLDLLFPIPDGRDFGDGTAELVHSHQDPTDEHFGVVKFDYNLSTKDTLMVRWSRDDSKTVHLTGASALLRAHRPRTRGISRRSISASSTRIC